MNNLQEMLAFNKNFVENKEYEAFKTTRFPSKRMVIVSCMDTRLTELLPRALNIKNGDVKIVKNAGAIITHPFGSIMRSILVAIYELGAHEVFIIGHHNCGMSTINTSEIIDKMKTRGISNETLSTLEYSGINIKKWFHGFDCVHDSVTESVRIVKNHPLLPKDITVHGLIINPETGELELVINGYGDE